MLNDVLKGFESAWHENGGGDFGEENETEDRLKGEAG
jgi:hypothetical protein